MNDTAHIANALLKLFVEQTNLTEQLFSALEKEYQVISENNIAEFEDVVKQKQQLATQLENKEKDIFSTLTMAEFTGDLNGLKRFLRETDNNTEYSKLHFIWNTLIEKSIKCNEQNQTNARIINVASINIRQVLKLISGQESNSELYTNSGKTVDRPGNKSFTTA